MIAGIPEVFDDLLDWGLGKDSVGFVIDDGSHEAGVDVETWHAFNLDPVVLV